MPFERGAPCRSDQKHWWWRRAFTAGQKILYQFGKTRHEQCQPKNPSGNHVDTERTLHDFAYFTGGHRTQIRTPLRWSVTSNVVVQVRQGRTWSAEDTTTEPTGRRRTTRGDHRRRRKSQQDRRRRRKRFWIGYKHSSIAQTTPVGTPVEEIGTPHGKSHPDQINQRCWQATTERIERRPVTFAVGVPLRHNCVSGVQTPSRQQRQDRSGHCQLSTVAPVSTGPTQQQKPLSRGFCFLLVFCS